MSLTQIWAKKTVFVQALTNKTSHPGPYVPETDKSCNTLRCHGIRCSNMGKVFHFLSGLSNIVGYFIV